MFRFSLLLRFGEKKRMLATKKKKLHTARSKILPLGVRESDSFHCFIEVHFGGAEGVWFWGA